MALQIKLGQTKFEDLHKVLELTEEELNSKKARLFPSGNTDNEPATVSIFLASLSAVKEYREELFLKLGVRKIQARNVNVHTYVEIQGGNDNNRPDGLIVITSGKTTPIIEWAGFVEAKISENLLDDDQIERYSDFARKIGINDIITISNYLTICPTLSPINSNKRSFNFYHWSWAYLKVIALRLIRTNSIEDEDHVYILSELRRYFDSHRKLRNFVDMGKDWKENVTTICSYNPDQKIKQDIVDSITEPLIQEEKDISLQLTDKSNFLVTLVSKLDRYEKVQSMLQDTKVVTSQYCIDGDKNKSFFVDIDFIRQEVRCCTKIEIERGKAQAQTTALLRMFENESGHLENTFVNAIYPRNKSIERDTISLAELSAEKENENVNFYSILNKDYGDTVKFFEIKTKDKLGKHFSGKKTFITNLEEITERFLNQIMEKLIK